MPRSRVTTQDVRPHLNDLYAEELAVLVGLVRDEVTSARAVAALIIIMDRASRPEILNYHDYLHSASWRRVRERKLREAGRQCALCPARKHLHVHHRTYERLGKERMDDLIVLCRVCHRRHHTKPA